MRYHFPYFGADLRLTSSQPDTSEHCETTDTDYRTRGVPVYSLAYAGTQRAYPLWDGQDE